MRLESFWQDLRFGFRVLTRRPGPTGAALLALALGIGLTSSVLIVIDAVLLEGLPYPDADRLVEVAGLRREGATAEAWGISHADFADWRARGDAGEVFSAFAVYSDPRSFTLQDGSEPEHLEGEIVSADYFQALGVAPVQGRLFAAEEERIGEPHLVILLGNDLWQRRFGGEPSVVGRRVRLNGESFAVVGVLPAGFQGATDGAQLWMPLSAAARVLGPKYVEARHIRWLSGIGRLQPGIEVERASAWMDTATHALEREYPESNEGIGVRVTGLREAWTGELRSSLMTLLGAAAFVLFIACANMASLLLVQAVERRRELSIRSALGAGRRRLVGQLLTEGLLLSLAGCVLGLLFASWLSGLVRAEGAAGFRSFMEVGLDPLVIASTMGISLLCALGAGLVPAWWVSRGDLGGELKQGAKGTMGRGGRHFQSLLMISEVALSLALLAAAGLILQGFLDFQSRDLGFRPQNVLTTRMDLKYQRYAETPAVESFSLQLLERLRSQPGVSAVALEGPGVPTDLWTGVTFTVQGHRDSAKNETVVLAAHHVTPGYFSLLGIPLLQGRDFQWQERGERPPFSIIVSDAVARRYWPGESPLGKRLNIGRNTFLSFEIVGVAADVLHRGLARETEEDVMPDVYFALLQWPPRNPPILNVLIRSRQSDVSGLAAGVIRDIRSLDPGLAVFDTASLEDRLRRQVTQQRLLVWILGLFAVLALALAAIGLYGLISYTATQRTREIGIRFALGADRRDVLRLIVGGGVALGTGGVVLGLTLAFGVLRVLRRIFFEDLSATGFMPFAVSALLLMTVSALASWLPACRAAKTEPNSALRSET
jgi:putative ABC transport system permease protein